LPQIINVTATVLVKHPIYLSKLFWGMKEKNGVLHLASPIARLQIKENYILVQH